MTDVEIARVVHVLSVVLWIGGVGFVTLSLLPFARNEAAAADGVRLFEALERRFANQARAWVLLAGASGFWITERYHLWSRFADPGYWWMHAMVVVWTIFAGMLFVAEPLVLDRWFSRRAAADPGGTLRLILVLHIVLLSASLIAVAGAVWGVHGL
jgi:hypothetical protein